MVAEHGESVGGLAVGAVTGKADIAESSRPKSGSNSHLAVTAGCRAEKCEASRATYPSASMKLPAAALKPGAGFQYGSFTEIGFGAGPKIFNVAVVGFAGA